jgi:hypothetical protein
MSLKMTYIYKSKHVALLDTYTLLPKYTVELGYNVMEGTEYFVSL